MGKWSVGDSVLVMIKDDPQKKLKTSLAVWMTKSESQRVKSSPHSFD